MYLIENMSELETILLVALLICAAFSFAYVLYVVLLYLDYRKSKFEEIQETYIMSFDGEDISLTREPTCEPD